MPAPIRVTYVIPTLEIGGAETQLVRLVNGLDRARFRSSLVCPFGFGPLKSSLATDVEAESLGLPDRRYAVGPAISAVAGIRGALSRQMPDIVHAFLMPAYVPSAFATWLHHPPALIASRRSLDTHARRSSFGLRAAARAANRRIDFHLCNSEAVRRAVIAEEGVPPERCGVIHNGIEVPDAAAGDRLSGGRDGCVAMIANLSANKRHADVVEAVRLIVKERPGLRLTMFGDGPERRHVERLIREYGLERNVELRGSTPNAASLLGDYDVSILASANEGFPNALLESMARGVPVVATRVGGVPELVRDGVDGLLVEPGRPAELAAEVLALLNDPGRRRELGDSGRRRVLDEFSVAAMVRATEDLYARLAGRAA